MVERSRALAAVREVRGSNLSADFRNFEEEEFFQKTFTSAFQIARTLKRLFSYSEEEKIQTLVLASTLKVIHMVFPSKNMGVFVVVMLEK